MDYEICTRLMCLRAFRKERSRHRTSAETLKTSHATIGSMYEGSIRFHILDFRQIYDKISKYDIVGKGCQ